MTVTEWEKPEVMEGGSSVLWLLWWFCWHPAQWEPHNEAGSPLNKQPLVWWSCCDTKLNWNIVYCAVDLSPPPSDLWQLLYHQMCQWEQCKYLWYKHYLNKLDIHETPAWLRLQPYYCVLWKRVNSATDTTSDHTTFDPELLKRRSLKTLPTF